jgi:hypothetical protein
VKGRVRAIWAVTAVGLCLASSPAEAASDEREARAKKACAAGRVDEGVELLAELFTQTGDVNYVYNQGRCYQQNGVADKAVNRFREYLRTATELQPEDRAVVERYIAELEQQRAATPPPREAEGSSRLRTAALVLGAAGALAIGTGVVLSLKVQSYERETNEGLASMDPVEPWWLEGRISSGTRLETFQWVAYGVGAAAIAGGVVCHVLGSRAPERTVAFAVGPAPNGWAARLAVRY